jgi:hypothetical protein
MKKVFLGQIIEAEEIGDKIKPPLQKLQKQKIALKA